ncbi:MAG: hypothetical protein EON98_15875 [Chitinophagaceae bacterium]|nr:MAG: hypothetical protein EON98_15875 [Chitinophagaceae bacterium]
MSAQKIFTSISFVLPFFISCDVTRPIGNEIIARGVNPIDTLITQSLFADKGATITEENVQKILDGNYQLPQKLRAAIVKLENNQQRRYWWNDEDYLKTQQSYLDLFTKKLTQSARVTKLSVIPDLLVSKSPSFTQIREAALRMQADVAVVYAINSDIYSNYKLFGKNDIKAFATTQLIILDVRTGLIPFSTVITRDVLSQKKKEELSDWEARGRIQSEAVLLTINEIGEQLTNFLQN